MSTRTTSLTLTDRAASWARDLRGTSDDRHLLAPRLIAGAPLLAIGLAHVFVADLGMRSLVDAAGLPLPALLSPLAVALEIIAGVALILGAWARVGAALALPTMVVALYAHAVIDTWPNGAENEPPLALPIVVILAAGYVLWRGAGRWSVDRR